MASAGPKDAYYSIPIAEKDRKFPMFEWKGQYYQYTLLPNGLSSAPRIFTKILKPVYANFVLLRILEWGILMIPYSLVSVLIQVNVMQWMLLVWLPTLGSRHI